MRLTVLQAEFLGDARPDGHRRLDSIDGAQGIFFLCPKCWAANGDSAIVTHGIIVWFANPRNAPPVPKDCVPKPARWTMAGTSLQDLTLTPSILLTGEGCGWHGFVTNGDAA